MKREEFLIELDELGISLTEVQEAQLEQYYQLLVQYNEHMNLTGITEHGEVYLKHFYDSLTLIKAIHLEKIQTLCDVGTGAGFPGIVLKIVFPKIQVTLLDSLNKRIEFLKVVIQELHLTDIEAIHTRAEEYAMTHREQFDVVTSRAVANLSLLSEMSLPMVKLNGYFIPMKGHLEMETEDLSDIVHFLGGRLDEIITFELPIEQSTRTLIKIKKVMYTNKKYPRKFSEMKKRPLSKN